jgi:hypothetical protein
MGWARILGGGVAAGIVMSIADFVMHGNIMAATYAKYPQVFTQTQANPAFFMLIAVAIGVTSAILFGRTRASWAPGWQGGLVYGFYVGLVLFFPGFYSALVYDGFPYYLVWCWGGITMIDSLLAGLVLGAVIPRS